jgi:alpha/beta superfamily hydrolase
MIFGADDGFIKPSTKEAAKLLKEKAKSSKDVTTALIPKAAHSYIGHEEELINVISKWITTL